MIPKDEWEWFGKAAHFICGEDCRFHLATKVGRVLVSTVGEYLPDVGVREVLAESRGVVLEGMGDARRADFMRKLGYEPIGFQRKYETMVFRAGSPCGGECGCGVPQLGDPRELDFAGYNSAADATRGHMALCAKWAEEQDAKLAEIERAARAELEAMS